MMSGSIVLNNEVIGIESDNYEEAKSILRKRILDISQKVSALHIGGTFSSAEIITVIYDKLINLKKDKFILSKGHAGILLYAILEQKKILKKKHLDNYCTKNGILGVHPDYLNPGISASTGSLGHGIGLASGMSLSKIYRNIYVLMSDGELMEGSVWEAILLISSFYYIGKLFPARQI